MNNERWLNKLQLYTQNKIYNSLAKFSLVSEQRENVLYLPYLSVTDFSIDLNAAPREKFLCHSRF